MRIADYAIRHPAVIGILLIALALFGLVSFQGVSRDLMANIELPEVLVLSVYPGASPEVVERDVTDRLEQEFSLVDGIRKISSESQDGVSMIFLTMDWNADTEAKKNDIRDRINNALPDLPDGLAGNPRIHDMGTSSLPVYTCTIESSLGEAELARLISEDYLLRFSRLSGVSAVYIRGVEEPALRVVLDPAGLESLDVTALEVWSALMRGQATIPAGHTTLGSDRLALQSRGDFSTPDEVAQMPVGYRTGGRLIYLRDIADVDMGVVNPEFRTMSNGLRTVAMDVMKKPGGDTRTLVAEVRRQQRLIETESGGSVRFVSVLDNAEMIGTTLRSVSTSAWLGGLLAVIVLLVFLHDLRSSLIVSLSIPFTVFLTFILMRIRGMSLNIMTLAGLTISIGMIVDASIVILENTVRHRKSGLGVLEAASTGAGEVGGAVLASTTTSLSAFLPILFVTGLAGAILKEVSWVLLFSLASSAATAVIIVPWLSANLPELPETHGLLVRFGERFDRSFHAVSTRYVRLLSHVLDRKFILILISILLVFAAFGIFLVLGGELFSPPDMNELEIRVRMPAGYDLERSERKLAEVAALVRSEVPEIETDLWYAGLGDSATIIDTGNPAEGYGRVRLVRPRRRERTVFDIVRRLGEVLPARITDADITVSNGGLAKQMNYATDGAGFRIEVSAPDWDDVLAAARIVKERMEEEPLIGKATYSVRLDGERLGVDIDRITTGRVGVDPVSAGRNLRILFAGEDAGTLRTGNVSYPIVVDSTLAGQPMPEGVLGRIRVRSAGGTTVPYTAFSRLSREASTDSIPHSDRLPSLIVVGELLESDLAGIRGRIEPDLRRSPFPPGVTWRVAGAAEIMGDTFRELARALAISIFLVYAVMVIQFERFTQPLIIMGSVPLVLIGVALSLAAFGGRISMMSFFGVIALAGMVVNNAIVLVDFTNQLRRHGRDIRSAILEAAMIRLKPILITTLTTLIGLIPLAFSIGEGSQIYAPLGQVIGGGLATSTLITLVLVPVLYEWVEIRRERRRLTSGVNRNHASAALGPAVLLTVSALALLPAGRLSAEEAVRWSISGLTDLALTDDPVLAAVREDYRSAVARLQGARAQRGPTFDLEFGAGYLSDPLLRVPAGTLGELPPPIGSIPAEDIDVWGQANDFRYDLTASIQQPIFTWGKISSGISAAESGSDAARWSVQGRTDEIRAGIVTAFESLSVLDRMLIITLSQEELGKRLAELSLSNFEAGFLLETEYRDTRNRLQQIIVTRSSLLKERQDLLLALEELSGLDGLETEMLELPAVDDTLETYVLPAADDLVIRAWDANAQVRALQALEDLSRSNLAQARGELGAKPDFALRTEFGYGGGFNRAPDDIDGNWQVTIGAVSTLIDSGRSRSGIRGAEADYAAAAARTEGGRRQVEKFIRSSLYSMDLNRENIAYYIGLRDADSARSDLKRSAWETGFGREEEWLLARLDMLASELSRLREVLLFIRSDRQVRRVAGLLPD